MPRPTPQPELPTSLSPAQRLAQIGAPKGSNLFAVLVPSDSSSGVVEEKLAELGRALKSGKNKVWVRRGGYAIVEKYEGGKGGKVWGEISFVLASADERAWRKKKEWPAVFSSPIAPSAPAQQPPPSAAEDVDSNGNKDDDDDLFENPNRRRFVVEESGDEESDEESEDDVESVTGAVRNLEARDRGDGGAGDRDGKEDQRDRR